MTINKGKIKTSVWSAICGAIIVMIVGFGWGDWVLGSTAQRVIRRSRIPVLVIRLPEER